MTLLISVLLVDDHASFRTSFSDLLETTHEIKVVATASNGMDAIFQTATHGPDVAIIDISMPLMDGIEVARRIRVCCAFTHVLMLSISNTPKYIERAMQVGALGYVLKEAIGPDLLEAIRAVYRGKNYFSLQIAEVAEKHLPRKGKDSWAA